MILIKSAVLMERLLDVSAWLLSENEQRNNVYTLAQLG